MTDAAEVNCYIKQNPSGEGFILLPRTNLDKASINAFLDERGRLIVCRLTNRSIPKTNDQNKAFWALASLHYRVYNGHAPTSVELKLWEDDLLKEMLFPVRPDSIKTGEFKAKDWRDITKEEAMEIISKMLSLISEADNIPASVELTCRDIFEWVNEQKKNPVEQDLEETGIELESLASSALKDL